MALAVALIRDVHLADDLFQQVVVAALEHRAHFRDCDHLLAWSIRAIRHRATDLSRRKKLQILPEEILDLFESQWGNPSGNSWSDRLEVLHNCLKSLASRARDLLRMKHGEGMSTEAIAIQMKRTPDAIAQNLCRIHRTLRGCIELKMGNPSA